MTKRKTESKKSQISRKPNKWLSKTALLIYSFLTFLTVIIGVWGIPDFLHQKATPDLQLAKEEKFVTGILLPDDVLSGSQILLQAGSVGIGFEVSDLMNGTDISLNPQFGSGDRCEV